MCLVMALMCASGVSTSPGCLGRFPRLGLNSPYLPLPAGKSLGWSSLADGVMDSIPVLPVVPTVLHQVPEVPGVLAALQPVLPPSISQPRQWDCAQRMHPRAAIKAHGKKIPIFYNYGCSVPW